MSKEVEGRAFAVAPMYLLTLTFGGISMSVAAVALLVRDLHVRRSARIRRRLGVPRRSEAPRLLPESSTSPPPNLVGKIDQWFERLVAQAGLRQRPQAVFLTAIALGLPLGGALFVWRGSVPAAVIGTLFGPLAVGGFLFYRKRRRRLAFQGQLPDVLELLARSVRAGESLEQAIDMVATTTAEPMAAEFRRCAGHLDLGLSVGSTLEAMTRRVPLMETRILAATLTLQLEAGGDLAVTLDRLAKVLRERLHYRQRFRAATAAGRASAILIAAATLAVVVYMNVWQPDYVQEFAKSLWGQAMLATAIALQVAGLAWLFRLLTPQD